MLKTMNATELAAMIEHTALKPDVTDREIERLCSEAKEFHFVGICVALAWVPKAVTLLKGSTVKTISVVGFPHGNTATKIKAMEAQEALEAGGSEVDMVINIGALKSNDTKTVQQDIEAVAQAVHRKSDALLKVIIETALLSNEEKKLACMICERAGADFVKTSTGFAASGATVDDVKLMKDAVKGRLRIKAAGGIRDYRSAISMVEAGADRLGCSASVSIINAAPK
jgi:deoxyribose-phosphate aldolase